MRALLFIALLAVTGAALAQNADFARLDRNGDGSVSRVEALADAGIFKRFAQFDANNDRLLSPDEYRLVRQDIEQRAREDAALTARVRQALTAEQGMPWKAISVEAYEGAVLLSGFVPAPDIVSRAGRVTAGISGVRTVQNNILVRTK